ncbi:MAG TPA: glycoside hydrolase family 44 protein [Chloroflexota bacterium]|nr:glycoside hydrolase family 44 protein [Chloroflexota bacterium]
MSRRWPLAAALCLALAGVAAQPAAIQAQDTTLWSFATPADTGGFQGQPADGASNAVSWVSAAGLPGGAAGAIKLDYSGSTGFNTSVMTGAIPAAPWDRVATISADVFVPKEVGIPRLGLGIQIDGPPASKLDVPVHLMGARGGWNHMTWPVHPGQLAGKHTFGFVLDTDEAMPAPITIANLKAVTPQLNVDATNVISTFDPNTLWGSNVAYYYPPSFFNDPATTNLARDAGFNLIRIPGGLNADVYHWNGNGVRLPDGSINPAARNADGSWNIDYSGWAPGFEVSGEQSTGDPLVIYQPNFGNRGEYDHTPPVDVNTLAHWVTGLGPAAQLMVDVNVGTASKLTATGRDGNLTEADVADGAREAAEWVRYYNQKLGLHVKYWEVGNELNPLGAEVGSHIRDASPQGWHWITADDYATLFRAYAKAMKAVDPSIKLAGPVGFLRGPSDASGGGNMMQRFIQQASDVVDVLDMHFYDSGRTEAEYLAVPSNLDGQIATLRGWIHQYAPQRAGQIAIGISEWGDYNNSYPIGDGLFAADLMGQIAKNQLAYGNTWDVGNTIPDNGALVRTFGFDAGKSSGGWETNPANAASMHAGWTSDPNYTRPGGTSLAVDYTGSTGANAGLSRPLAGTRGLPLLAGPGAAGWSAVDEIRADVFIPQVQGNDAINLWLRIENADGSIDDSYRDQPQPTIWGRWNRILFPIDPAKLAHARKIAIVVNSPIPIATPLYFGEIETQKIARQPNARYWAAYMYHHYFGSALLASSLGDVSFDRLGAYASRAADGAMYLMVINKDPAADITMPVNIAGYTPAPQAEAYTWSGDNYSWDAGSGSATKDTPPSMQVVGAGPQFTYTFPKYSITALKLYPK